jgi:hypothetical protein
MTHRHFRWIALAAGLPLLLLAAAALAAYWLVPSREALAQAAEARARETTGVAVRIGSLDWALWPVPSVVLEDVQTLQAQPLTARRIEATLRWRDLLARRIALATVQLDGAVVPQLSLHALGEARRPAADRREGRAGADDTNDAAEAAASTSSSASASASVTGSRSASRPATGSATGSAAAASTPGAAASAAPSSSEVRLPGGWQLAPIPLEVLRFDQLTWISRRGIAVIYAGEVEFDASWRPRRAAVTRPGAQTRAELTLTRLVTRQGKEDRWQVRTTLGGGSLDGEVRLAVTPAGRLRLSGELAPQNIEIAAVVTTFNRRAVVSGRGSGRTVLEAEGSDAAELARSLHTRTQFRVAPATVLRFDLRKAIRTLGREHDGQTPLDSLTGEMDTQATGQGTIWSYRGLRASSGALTASGQVVIFARRIEAQGAVDLVDGLVGAPIKVSGTLDRPDVSVPGSAVAGAMIGTAILPGIGTAIGARLGALFSGDAPASPSARPSARSSASPPASTPKVPAGPRAASAPRTPLSPAGPPGP